MSFYHLPHPWNPGYAIPKYVMAEPPERGTFTTAWYPRGTISQVVPDYLAVPQRGGSSLAKHSLAGNCFVDNSLAGSSLRGDSLGATAYELEPLGQANFGTYGTKVARKMIATVQRLPASSRGPAMKRAMAAIDPTLQSRAEKYALAEKRRGAPPKVALERGIARAVSDGALTELARLGKNPRAKPQFHPLRGLGRSHMALGADRGSIGSGTLSAAVTSLLPQKGQCSADEKFVWDFDAGGIGYWRRRGTGEACTSIYAGASPTTGGVQGGITGAPASSSTGAGGGFRAIEVGPFQFPADSSWSASTWWGKKLPATWQAFIRRVASGGSSQLPYLSRAMSTFFDAPVNINPQYVGMTSRTGQPTWNPVARVVHPETGKDYGIFLAISFRYPDKAKDDPVANPPVLNVIWAPIQKSTFEAIWDWIEKLVGKMIDVAKDALDAVTDLTCELLQSPGVTQAALQAAAASPSPQTAGAAAGVAVGQRLCGGEKIPEMPTTPSTGGGLLLPLAIAGGGLLVVMLIARSR